MSKVFIISTRSMKDGTGIWLHHDWIIKKIDRESPFVQNLLKDREGSYIGPLTVYKKEKKGWDSECACSWAMANGESPREALDAGEYEEYVEFTLSQRSRSVPALRWDQCYSLDKGDMKVFALQHLPYNLTKEESKAWVTSLLDTFASPEDEVCLILHDKDLDRYNDYSSFSLSCKQVKRYTARDKTQIIVFEHSESKVSSLFNITEMELFLERLSSIHADLEAEEMIREQKNKM